MEVSILTLISLGVMVGLLISLDNTAATAALASKFGANLYVLFGEILAHIIIVTLGWFLGYIFMGYEQVTSYITAGALFLLGSYMLWGVYPPKEIIKGIRNIKELKRGFPLKSLLRGEADIKAATIWTKEQERRFLLNFFFATIPLVIGWVALLQMFMSANNPVTGLFFIIGVMTVFLTTATFSAKRAGIKWPW